MNTVIKENEYNVLLRRNGYTYFRGCQCFKDCGCKEGFKSEEYEHYAVIRKNKKETIHKTLEEALERWDIVKGLPPLEQQLTNK